MKANAIKKIVSLVIAMMLLMSIVVVASAEVIEPAPAAEAPAPEAPKHEDPPKHEETPKHSEAPKHTDAPVVEATPTTVDATSEPTAVPTDVPEGEPTEELLDPTATPEATAEPHRSVTIKLQGEQGSFQYGETVTLEAILSGYEGVNYYISWEYSENGVDEWTAAPDSKNQPYYQFTLDEENALWYWRAVVETL